jgi:Kef-type K+ transport system membrane component KefB
MASSDGQKPVCPVCHQSDQVKKLQEAYEAGIERFAPPPMPGKRVSMAKYMVIGMGLVFLGSFFIIVTSVSVAPDVLNPVAELIQVVVTLVAIVITLIISFIAFQRALQGDEAAQELYPAWDRALANWRRLYYCSRDDIVFDPKVGKAIPDKALTALLAVEEAKSVQTTT